MGRVCLLLDCSCRYNHYSLSTKLREILTISTTLENPEEIDQLAKRATSALLVTTKDILGREANDENLKLLKTSCTSNSSW